MRAALALVPLAAACSGGGGDLELTDEHNYTFTGSLGVQEVEVQPETDLTFDWSGVTTDLRQRPFDGSIDEFALVEPFDDIDTFLEKAVRNQFKQADLQYSYLAEPAESATSILASELGIIGNELDVALLGDGTAWLASLNDYPEGRTDLLMSKVIRPTAGSTNTVVSFTDGCTELTYDVDMHSMPALTAADGATPILDWSGLTQDVHGNAFDPLLGDELLVARFDAGAVEEVEAQFLQLDSAAAELYRTSVYGETDADLSELQGFGGFTRDGVWMVGLVNTTALSPVPLALARVEVE